MEISNKIKKQPTILHSYGWKTQVSPVIDYTDVQILFDKIEKREDITQEDKDYDRYQIFVSCNVWCLLYGDIIGQTPLALKHYLIGNGLQAAVAEANSHYGWLASNGKHGKESPFWTSTLKRAFGSDFVEGGSAKNITADISTLLKCIKRLQLRTIKIDERPTWLSTNNQCRSFCVDSWYSSEREKKGVSQSFGHPSARLMSELREVFEWAVENWEQDASLFRLPPGSTAERWPKCYLDKFKVCVEEQVWLRQHGVNIPVISIQPRKVRYQSATAKDPMGSALNAHLRIPRVSSRFLTVPKNIEKGRGVCPEPVSKQVLGYQVSSGLYRCLKTLVSRLVSAESHNLDTKDQSWNQQLISDDRYATLDLKAASDSISYRLGSELCARRPDLWEKICACRSRLVEFEDGSWEVNHHLVTMGNAITFNLETIIFACIVVLAMIKYLVFAADSLTQEDLDKILEFAVYGDDIVVANELAETVTDLLHIFGFVVNEEKSFINDGEHSFYRESCGVEYRDDLNVTGSYFPRSLGDLPSAELVSLQHKYVMYENTSTFLTQCVLDVLPTTIISEVGSEYNDLWALYPVTPDLAGSSDYGKFYTKFALKYTVKHEEGGYSLKTDSKPLFHEVEFNLAHSAQKLNRLQFLLTQGSVMCYHEDLRDLHSFQNVKCVERETWLKTYRLDSVDDYEYHMIIGSRQNRSYPLDFEERELLELCMYLLTIGNGLEHMKSDQFLKPIHEVRERRDLLGDREILWQKKRTLR